MKSIHIAKETREVFISKISTIENLSHGEAVQFYLLLFIITYFLRMIAMTFTSVAKSREAP